MTEEFTELFPVESAGEAGQSTEVSASAILRFYFRRFVVHKRHTNVCVRACVRACVRERERERECVCVCVYIYICASVCV